MILGLACRQAGDCRATLAMTLYMNQAILQTLGLSSNEAKIYELLLKLGEVEAQIVIAQTGLKRATAYKALYDMEEKGIVSKRDIGKTLHFKPEPPTSLLTLAEDRYNELERVRRDVRSILPQLTSAYILAVEKPVVSTFEGVEGLKQMYEDTLREKQPIYAVLQAEHLHPELYRWLESVYVKRRVKLGIPATVIVASSTASEKYVSKDARTLRTTRVVDRQLFPFAHEVDIYGQKIAFINYKKDEALIGVVIDHPRIAQTMKAFFDLAWIGATKQQAAH